MTVGKLREILKNLDPDMPVVTHGRDHSYNGIGFCGMVSAEGSKFGELYEFYGLDSMNEDSTEVLVFLISDM